MSRVKRDPAPRDNIPRNIKILLAALDKNQAWLADRLHVPPAYISRRMKGSVNFDCWDLDRIAEILHTTPAKLYTPPVEFAENCTRLIC